MQNAFIVSKGPGEIRSAVRNDSNLGELASLAGTWEGEGFNLISRPVPQTAGQTPTTDGRSTFFLDLRATRETITFSEIGGDIPNRGFVEPTIALHGLNYLQQVIDANTGDAIHLEPGLFLSVPSSTQGGTATIARLATIPHGNSLMAQGTVSQEARAPNIDPANALPGQIGLFPEQRFAENEPYLSQFEAAELPAGIACPPGCRVIDVIKNPNLLLTERLRQLQAQGFSIPKTVNLPFDTLHSGGLVNIPFVVANANAVSMSSIFWIETVVDARGEPASPLLQYTQTVILDFDGVSWPHISVATLSKVQDPQKDIQILRPD
ncbi:heme-binding protein [Chromobacterium haemolyticum]|uniref:heme-binding protein n=1 Tax=Chromobacterium haemolyticum TaxID=394935 RepID=UPI004057512D